MNASRDAALHRCLVGLHLKCSAISYAWSLTMIIRSVISNAQGIVVDSAG